MWPASHQAQAGLTYTPKNEINADARIVRRMANASSYEEGRKISRVSQFLCDELHGRRTALGCGRAGTTERYAAPTHGYEPTREAAMAAFAKSWRCSVTRR